MKSKTALCLAALVAASRAVAGDGFAPSGEKSVLRQTFEGGGGMNGIDPPLGAIHAHLCGFHFYSGDMARQLVAHHYCAQVSEDVWQCVLFDSDKADARLIGIEYVISGKIFQSLPEDEKKLWHSHAYEVKSGMLVASGLPAGAEQELMQQLAGTYGKTWHTWQVDRGDQVPLGIPQLMMGFTADGQVKPELIEARDQRDGASTAEKKKDRTGIVAPAIQPGADAWQKGGAIQLQTAIRQIANPIGK